MLACKAIIPGRLALFAATAPLGVRDVMENQNAIAGGRVPGISLDTPSILDFTNLRQADLSAADLGNFIRQRRALLKHPTTGPLAFVCRELGTFGVLRMFSMLAEVGGLWKEDQVLVTRDPLEAFNWIAERAELDEAERSRAAESLQNAGWDAAAPVPQ